MRTKVLVCLAAGLVLGVACTGSDSGGAVFDAAPDVAPGLDVVPDVWQPQCDPYEEDSGCADGELCWFGHCLPVSKEVLGTPEQGRVAGIATLAGELGGSRLVATSTHELRRDDLGVLSGRDDGLGVYWDEGSGFGAFETLASWSVDSDRERPAPVVHVVDDGDGSPIVVSGPRTLRAYAWDGESWQESHVLDTGARQYGSEGTFAAVVDGSGALHVAYRDVQMERLEIATLQPNLSWEVVSPRSELDGWGSLVVGAKVEGRAVFAHIYAEEDSPSVVRWALVVEQDDAGWVTSEPSLGQGLAIRGRVMGFDAASDSQGRLSLGWVSSSQRFGVAVRGSDGNWTTDDSYISDKAIWDDLNRNLRLRWRGDSPVVTWLGYPERECDCFDLRMAIRLRGEWQERRLDMFEGMNAGGLSLDVSADGYVMVSVGGGTEVLRGLDAPVVYSMDLPVW